jgi:hypothetical protein
MTRRVAYARGSHRNEFSSTVSHPIWEVALIYISCMRHVFPDTLNTWAQRKRKHGIDETLPSQGVLSIFLKETSYMDKLE